MIDDSHAMRTLDTRLGAIFLVALIIAVIAIFVFVIGEQNIFTTSALVPAPQNTSSMKIKDYGQLNITAHIFAPRDSNSPTCQSIVELDTSTPLGCDAIVVQGNAGIPDSSTLPTMSCMIQINCTAQLNIRGTEQVKLGIPEQFQIMEWSVWSAHWDGYPMESVEPVVTTHHVLGPSINDTFLAGTEKNPTALNFGVTRSVVHDKRNPNIVNGCRTSGLRLSWRDVERVESTEGSESGKHFVAFRFAVDGALFQKVLDLKLTPVNQLSMVITYCLTAIAVLTSVKSVLQMLIDKALVKLAQKNGTEPPEDVQRRIRVLDEHAITGSGQRTRRLSSAAVLRREENNVNLDGSGIEMINVDGGTSISRDVDSGNDVVFDASDALLVKRLQQKVIKSEKEFAESKKKIASMEKTIAQLMKHLSLTPSNGEVKVDDPAPAETTAISIKDEVPTRMHSNPHWSRLKKSVKATNAFKASSAQKKRTKRLSTAMKSRRNSALKQDTQ